MDLRLSRFVCAGAQEEANCCRSMRPARRVWEDKSSLLD